ncbi:hypothetical protein HYQ46_008664 [Verticillium longisporum]|nr:hypothetical protein HYQ46_008664 [Verticillium longisporum]
MSEARFPAGAVQEPVPALERLEGTMAGDRVEAPGEAKGAHEEVHVGGDEIVGREGCCGRLGSRGFYLEQRDEG